MVSMDEILLDYVPFCGHIFFGEFVESSIGSDLDISSDEEFQFGIWEDDGSYITTIHYDAFVGAEIFLYFYEFTSDLAEGGDFRDDVRDIYFNDTLCDIFTI